MTQLPSADLPFVTPGTNRINLEWFTALQRLSKGVDPNFINLNSNGFAVSVDPPDSYGGNAIQVLGTSAAAGFFAHLRTVPTGDIRMGFSIYGVYDGTVRNAAAITSFSEAAWTIGVSHPANIKFETTAAGSTTRTERLRVQADGMIRFAAPSQIANGAVATVLGSLGPVGSHTTVQEWLQIVNASGVTRYIPCF